MSIIKVTIPHDNNGRKLQVASSSGVLTASSILSTKDTVLTNVQLFSDGVADATLDIYSGVDNTGTLLTQIFVAAADIRKLVIGLNVQGSSLYAELTGAGAYYVVHTIK